MLLKLQYIGIKRRSFLHTVFKFIYLFSEREREADRMSRGGTEREGKRIPSRLHTVNAEPNVGLKLKNCEIMT